MIALDASFISMIVKLPRKMRFAMPEVVGSTMGQNPRNLIQAVKAVDTANATRLYLMKYAPAFRRDRVFRRTEALATEIAHDCRFACSVLGGRRSYSSVVPVRSPDWTPDEKTFA
jgi:hypothetical protein